MKWTANGYRLPTEAEWEFAARGGTKSQGYTYSGSNAIVDVAWSPQDPYGGTRPVATKGANELGLYDMSGNACEWCWDWYRPLSTSAQMDPRGATTGSKRTNRGGSFAAYDYSCPMAYRFYDFPTSSYHVLGFRCVQH